MGKKRVYEVECNCGMMVKGFSEHHAKQNMIIHKKASRKHKELLALKEKWLKQKS
jgi:hypothetical protein